MLFLIESFPYHSFMFVSDSNAGHRIRSENVAETMRRDILRRRLFSGVSRLGVAVSGGADSVALLHLLSPLCREAGIPITVLHFNHGLRREATEDACFVNRLADSLHIPFLSGSATTDLKTCPGESTEMAARTARMAFFARCAGQANLDAIATGHQADDVAENVLLRLARGAGATGLSGLRPRSPLSGTRVLLIRPLLSVSGRALRDWLTRNRLDWREDATNRDATIPRNFVRNVLLPQLEKTWLPDVRARLCQSAEALREDDALLETLARQARETLEVDGALTVSSLRRQPEALQRRILRQWLFERNLADSAGQATVLALLERCADSDDWNHPLPGGVLAGCRNDRLRILRAHESPPEAATVPIPGSLRWGSLEIIADLNQGVCTCADGTGRYPAICSLALGAVAKAPLRIRSRHPGDRIAPTGLDGSKKIQDLFVDEKIPEERRDQIPLLTCGDEIVWVPGYRIARAFAVPSPDAPCLRISVRELE